MSATVCTCVREGPHLVLIDPECPARRSTVECANCGREFDPIHYRWLCPHCKHKNTCCEGAPL